MLNVIKSTGIKWLWVAALVVAVDQYSKYWAMTHLAPFEPWFIFPIFNFTLTYNTGSAFGFLHTASGWQNIFFTGLAVIVGIIIICWLRKLSHHISFLTIGLNLVLGGAFGNAWDRLHYGFVVDFLSFHLGDWYFAIFNIADSAICVGAFMLILDWMYQRRAILK